MGISRRKIMIGVGSLAPGVGTIRWARAADEPIRLGFMTPLSGVGASLGQPTRLGAEAAQNYLNQNGGVNGRQIELVELDDAGNATKAVEIVREFASRGINLIVGPSFTNTAMAVAPLLPELKCTCIFMGTGEIRLTHDLFNRNIWVTAESSWTKEHAVAQTMATRYPEVTTWTGAIPDNAVGYDGWAAFKRAMADVYPKVAKREPNFVDPVVSKYGTTDFKIQISQLATSPADGFWTTLFGADGYTFYKQALQFGVTRKFKAMIDWGIDIGVPKTLKRDVPSNLWVSCYWYYGANPESPISKEIVRVFTAAGDPYPSGFAKEGGTPVLAFAAAIKAAGSTETERVISALEGLNFESVSGPAFYRKEDHQLVARSYMVRYEPSDVEPGWKTAEFVAIEDRQVINPPSPGQKWIE